LYYKNLENNFNFAKKIQRVISLEEIYIVDNLINKTTTKIIKNYIVNLLIQNCKCFYFFIIYIYLKIRLYCNLLFLSRARTIIKKLYKN
jgi:DNA integrity scanning protein DisA with diadenylate cyclase activity